MAFFLKKYDPLPALSKRVAGVAHQINPFDNGATYNTVLQNRQPIPNRGSFTQNNIIRPAAVPVHMAGGLLHTGLQTSAIVPAVAVGGIASLTGNKPAANKAFGIAHQGVNAAKDFAQGTAATGYQLGESLNPRGGDVYSRVHTPTGLEAKLLGHNPIPSIQSQYKQTAADQGGTTAKVEAALTALMDATVVKGGAKPLGKASLKTAETTAKTAQKVVNPEHFALDQHYQQLQKSYDVATTQRQKNTLNKLMADNRQANLSKLSAEEKADLSPKQQMALAEMEGKAPKAKAPIEENAAKNPYKPNIRPVAAGDYKGARIAPGQVSHPIRFAGDRLDSALARLEKKSPQEAQNFWRLIEDPAHKGSKEFTKAKQWWREVANAGHGVPVALGHNTNYLSDFALHPWMLKGVTEEAISSGGPGIIGKHAQSRIHRTIAEGEASGLELGGNPRAEAQNYARGVANAVDRLAFKKAAAEADAHNPQKTRTMDLGHGHTIPLSDEGYKKLKAFEYHQPSANKAIKGLRTVNTAAKSTVLSASQFHTVNIGALRAGPALALKGHPIAAAKGVGRMFRGLTPGGRAAAERVMEKAYQDGMVHKAAELGMPYGAKGYNTEGTSLKSGVGHRLVFETQMPMMHDQVVRSIAHDLEKKHIPLNSREARDTGVMGNATMGFINKQALNLSPKVRQGMSDFMLAGQFTPSKAVTLGKITKVGEAGNYARADVAANAIAAVALVSGIGYLAGQKSDNARDLLLRALVNPAAPTGTKDAKGNNVELRTPLTYTAEISKLLGISLRRGADGHLHPSWNPSKIASADSPTVDWFRSRLSPIASTGVKLATNTNFANKPLYDPNAPAGTKASQAATTIAQGSLPIGVQGLAFTGPVKNRLPGTSKEILDANTPGSNAVLKSALSSIGFTPRTDQTVGKAKDTKSYFDAVEKFKPKDRQASDAYDLWTGSKKNPVTGKYDVQPGYNDARAKASALLDNPKAFNAIVSLNQNLAKKGQEVDPLWTQDAGNIRKYLQYQVMEPGGASKSVWYDNNKGWYGPLADARGKFFTSLPPGDPNKPKLDLQYPEASKPVQSAMDQYSNLTDSAAKGAFLDAHPDVIKQWNAQSNYTNEIRKKLGYQPLKNYPEPTDKLQSFMDSYSAADKATKKGIRSANPQQYQSMIAYFDSVDLYNINKQGAKSQLQGQPDYTSKQAGAISNLAKDIYKNPDGTYSVVPAGWMQGLSHDGSGGYGSSGPKTAGSSRKYAVSLKAGGAAPHANISAKKIAIAKAHKSKKPKVTLKKTS